MRQNARSLVHFFHKIYPCSSLYLFFFLIPMHLLGVFIYSFPTKIFLSSYYAAKKQEKFCQRIALTILSPSLHLSWVLDSFCSWCLVTIILQREKERRKKKKETQIFSMGIAVGSSNKVSKRNQAHGWDHTWTWLDFD